MKVAKRLKSCLKKTLRIHTAHNVLCERVSLYAKWHQHPHHRKVHYSSAAIVVLAAAALIYNSLFIQSGSSLAASQTQTVGTQQDWEQGTLSGLDTQDVSGDLKLASAGSWGARALMSPPNSLTLGVNFTTDGTDIYVLRGNTDNAFYKYSPATDAWTELAPALEGVYGGGSIAMADSNTIYSFPGNSKKTFYKYTVSTDSWERMDDLPDTVNTGSSAVWANGYLWVIRSQSSQDFWKFNPAAAEGERWSSSYGLPALVRNATSLMYDGTQYIYVLRGYAATAWYRFDTLNPQSWSTMTTTYPVNIDEWTQGAYYNGAIYVNHPNSATLYKCQISALTCDGGWQTLPNLPAVSRYGGIQPVGSLLYVFRGNNTFDLWAFNSATGASGMVEGPAMYPQAVATGGDLLYDSSTGITYGLKGGAAANGFYSYNAATRAWTLLSVVGLPAISYDTKAVLVSGKIYAFQGNARTFYCYDTANDAAGWVAKDVFPVALGNVGNGGTLVYNAAINPDLIFASRGGGTVTMAAYSISNNNWTTFVPANLPSAANVNIGGRLVASGDKIYAILGSGSSRFFRYDYAVGGGSWTELSRAPFSPYYGTDLTAYNGKIYAMAGNYRKFVYEYDTATTVWRRLPDFSGQYQYDLGSYSGASLEYVGGTSLMLSRGSVYTGGSLASQEIINYNIGATSFLSSGEYISPPIDVTFAESWTSLVVSQTTPGDSSVVTSTRVSLDGSNWSEWQNLSGSSVQSSAARKFIQVKIVLNSSTDGTQTPSISGYALNYESDETAPTNPSAANVTAFSQEVGGSAISASPATYPYSHPHFVWPSVGQDGAAADAGSGVAGYYVYFGNNVSADPLGAGYYTTDNSYTVNDALTTGDNYLRVSTKDRAGRIALGETLFIYNYSGVSPSTSDLKTTTNHFETGASLSNISASGDELKLSSKSSFWREYRLSSAPSTMGYGSSMVYKSALNKFYVVRGSGASTFWEYDVATDVWTTLSSTGLGVINYGGGLVDGPGNYIYAARGGTSNSFYRYDITNNTAGWSDADAEDAPSGCFTYGGQLISDGSRYIYATKGGDDNFYRFDPLTTSDGEWLQRANINFGYPNQTSSINAANGASLAYDGLNTIYAIQGGNVSGFGKYTISGTGANTWLPVDTALPTVSGAGSNIVWDDINQRLIYISGVGLRSMYSYNPANSEWTKLSAAPSYFSYNTSVVKVGDYLYVFRGSGTSSFYKYNIRKNSWFMPNNDLFGPSWYEAPQVQSTYFGTYAGSDMVKGDGGNLYAIRGNYDNKFIKYNSTSGLVSDLANLPAGSYQDSSLVYDEDDNAIYAIVGAADRGFFKYSIANNSWSEYTSDRLPAAANVGASLAYDGSRYIYYMVGNGTAWYRFDKDAVAGAAWSAALPTTSFGGASYGTQVIYKDGYLYAMRGANINPNILYRFDTSLLPAGAWTALASVTAPLYYDGFLIDGQDGNFYLSPAGNSAVYGRQWWRYNISGNAWTQDANFPGTITYGGAGAYNGSNKIFAFSGPGTDSFSEGIYSYTMQSTNTSFEESGVYVSGSIDMTSVGGKNIYAWGNLTTNNSSPSNTVLTIETQSSTDNVSWSGWSAVNKEKTKSNTKQYSINSPLGRYLRVRITMISGDGYLSPTLSDFAVTYYRDLTNPANPTALSSAKLRSGDATDIVDSNWYNSNTPYFAWPALGQAGAASDGAGGSGIAGYYVYLGETAGDDSCSGNPSTSSGLLTANEGSLYYQAATDLSVPSGVMSNDKSYCLRVTAKDNAGNVQSEPWQVFKYRYETTLPTNPSGISVNPMTYTNIDNYTFTIPDDAADEDSGLQKIQYQTGADGSTWYDFDPLLGTSVTLPNANHTQAKYRDGANIFKVRVIDNANNISLPLTTNFYYGSTAPSPPQGLTVSPSEPASTNSFTFEWENPATYVGDPSKITYHYSINAEPTQYNTNATGARAAGPGPFATQRDKNSFYVVAEDEANNIDWLQYAKIDFYADTSAPAAPSYVNASDISDKEAEQYRLVVSWMAPEISDTTNFAGYDIYESSEEEGEYQKIDRTTGTAYVHLNLEKDSQHFYKVYSVDKTNNVSAPSEPSTATATGRFTKPPNITKEPVVDPHARSATIGWNTSREANSAVEYGLTQEFGQTVGNRATDYVTDHSVDLGNLQPGTQYYFRTVYTDPDGNTGYSEPGSFFTAPAPLVSAMKNEDITLSSMLISWESNVPSYGSIKYGKTSAYSSKVEEEHFFTRKHTVKLDGLESDTAYHFQVEAMDEEGNIFTSDDYVQSTLPLPRVFDLKVENLTNVEKPTMSISYKTNVETTTLVRYMADGGKQKEYLTSTYSKEHSFELADLLANTNYSLEVTGRDRYGNEAKPEIHKITSLSDTMPPRAEKINDRKKILGEGKDAEAQLTVKVTTSEPTTMQIEAAKGVDAKDFNIVSNVDGLNIDHSLVMKLGEAGSPYSYRLRLIDSAGNVTLTETRTLVLSSGNKTAFDYIVSVFSRSFSWLGAMFK